MANYASRKDADPQVINLLRQIPQLSFSQIRALGEASRSFQDQKTAQEYAQSLLDLWNRRAAYSMAVHESRELLSSRVHNLRDQFEGLSSSRSTTSKLPWDSIEENAAKALEEAILGYLVKDRLSATIERRAFTVINEHKGLDRKRPSPKNIF